MKRLPCCKGAQPAGEQRAGLLMAAPGTAIVRPAGMPGGSHAALHPGGRPEAAPPDV